MDWVLIGFAMLTGFIAAYIDFNKKAPTGDELVDNWLDLLSN